MPASLGGDVSSFSIPPRSLSLHSIQLYSYTCLCSILFLIKEARAHLLTELMILALNSGIKTCNNEPRQPPGDPGLST